MKTPSISLKRTLDVTMKDTLKRINELSDKESQPLKDEYKEWLEASDGENNQPYVLYLNQIKTNI